MTVLVHLLGGALAIIAGFVALTSEKGTAHGIPAWVYLVVAASFLAGAAGDFRVTRSAGLTGAPRLARHLWRMCMALWIATSSFFLGPRWRVAKVLPEAFITTPVLIAPVLLVIVAMLYWLWRVRIRRTYRGIGIVSASEAV